MTKLVATQQVWSMYWLYLEELVLVNMRHISVDGLKCFRGHSALKAATIGLGSMRRNAQAV